MALPCEYFVETLFVDRESDLNELLEIITQMAKDNQTEAYNRIVHLIGKSGIGKSSLICKCHHYIHAEVAGTKSFLITFNDSKFKNVSSDQFIVMVINSLLSQIGPHINRVGVKDIEPLSNSFYSSIFALQNEYHVALFFDEINMLTPKQISDLEDYLLAKCIKYPNVTIVFAGRRLVTGFKDFDFRPLVKKESNKVGRKGNIIELSGFDYQNTLKQINAFNMPQIEVFAPDIYEITNGSPGSNRKIIEKIAIASPSFDKRDAIHACNEDLYEVLSDAGHRLSPTLAAELLPALEALCVLQDFDKEYEVPILLTVHTGLSGVWDLKRSSELLNFLSNIYIGPGNLTDWDINKNAYIIEEQVRFDLEQGLKIGNPVLWKRLHCTAMKMYADWAREYNSDIFETKSEHHRKVLRDAGFDPETCQEG